MRIAKLAALHRDVVHINPDKKMAALDEMIDTLSFHGAKNLSKSDMRQIDRLPIRVEEKWINAYPDSSLYSICQDCFAKPS